MKDLWQRTVTAILMAIVGIGAVILSQYGFAVLAVVLLSALIFEFSKLTVGMTDYTAKAQKAFFFYRAFIGSVSFAIIFIWVAFDINVLPLLAVMPILIIIPELRLASPKAFNHIILGVFSIIYIALPIAMASLIAFPSFHYDPYYLLGILVLTWSNDIFAYLVGKWVGRTPLARKVSPKKTIEGTMGGVIGTIALAFAVQYWWPMNFWFDWPIIGLIAALAGIAGDLAESLIKRNLQIKDSGTLLPGHGGLLDRFDAMLFSIPAVLIYLLMRNIIL